tara:strand:- start:7666 stop:8559 length:894 start_codon:yes stop_codon:yes gene_type:complete
MFKMKHRFHGEHDEGSAPSDWRDSLPEEVRADSSISSADTPEKLVAELVNLRQHMGNSLRLPRDDASPEQVEEFTSKAVEKFGGIMRKPVDEEGITAAMRAMGLPEEADGYKALDIEGFERTDEEWAKAKADAHALNMTQAQFNAKAERDALLVKSRSDERTVKFEEDSKALKAEWGVAYDERLAKVDALMSSAGYESLAAAIDIKTPEGVRAAYAIAAGMGISGEGLNMGSQGDSTNSGVKTPMQALAEVDQINDELMDIANPPRPSRKAVLLSQKEKLMRMAYPEDAAQDRAAGL